MKTKNLFIYLANGGKNSYSPDYLKQVVEFCRGMEKQCPTNPEDIRQHPDYYHLMEKGKSNHLIDGDLVWKRGIPNFLVVYDTILDNWGRCATNSGTYSVLMDMAKMSYVGNAELPTPHNLADEVKAAMHAKGATAEYINDVISAYEGDDETLQSIISFYRGGDNYVQ